MPTKLTNSDYCLSCPISPYENLNAINGSPPRANSRGDHTSQIGDLLAHPKESESYSHGCKR